ncbi:hypothetical protein ACSFBF_21030 [Variovorax sp. ZT5P49]
MFFAEAVTYGKSDHEEEAYHLVRAHAFAEPRLTATQAVLNAR